MAILAASPQTLRRRTAAASKTAQDLSTPTKRRPPAERGTARARGAVPQEWSSDYPFCGYDP